MDQKNQKNIFNASSAKNQHQAPMFASDIANSFMSKMPSSLARATLYGMLSLITFAIIWAYFGETDITVNAKGLLVPKGDVKHIITSKEGVVKKIVARSGMHVNQGDILLQLDTNIHSDTFNQLSKFQELLSLRSSEFIKQNTILLLNTNELKRTKEVIQKEISTKNNMLTTYKKSFERITEQYNIFAEMFENGLISKIEMLREKDSLEKARIRIEEITTDIETYKARQDEKINSNKSQILKSKIEIERIQNDINDAKRNIEVISLKYDKSSGLDPQSEKAQYDVIRAPVDGIVSFSDVHYEKDYLKPGTKVFSILPDNRPLVAKIEIPNTGIGQVKLGQDVKIKYDAYPYQQFGVGEGVLVSVAPNSTEKDAKKQEFVYNSRVELTNTKIMKNGNTYPLFAGLTLTAEIVVERKRILQFLLDFMRGVKK